MLIRWLVPGLMMTATLVARPTEGQAQAAGARAPTMVCLAGEGPPRLLRLKDGALEQCREDGDQWRCYAIQLSSGRAAPLPAPPPSADALPRIAPLDGAPVLTVDEASVKVCRAGGTACKTIKASGEVDPGLGMSAAVDPTGTQVVLSYLDGGTVVETFELATGKALGKLHGRNSAVSCIEAAFAGSALLVRESECGEDPSLTWLATPAGKRLAEVGGKKRFALATAPAHVAGDDWAFASKRGDAVVIQNVRTGKVTRRVAIGRASKDATVNLVGDPQHLVLVQDGAAHSELAVIDLKTFKVAKVSALRCPGP